MGSSPSPPFEITEADRKYVLGVVRNLFPLDSRCHEDLTQEVLLQAFRSRDSRLNHQSLLFGVARHVVHSCVRKEKRRRHAEETEKAVAPETSADTPETAFREAQRSQAVHVCLDGMPPELRDVLLLSDGDELPMKEVAARLGIPLNTGYDRLHRARERLKEVMKRHLARRRIGKDDLGLALMLPGLVEMDHDPARTTAFTIARIWPWIAGLAAIAGSAVMVLLLRCAPLADPPWRSVEVAPPTATTTELPTIALEATAPESSEEPRTTTPSETMLFDGAPEPPAAMTVVPPRAPALSTSAAAWSSDEAAWARRIRSLQRKGQMDAAARETAAFRQRYPRSALLLDPGPGR